MIYAPNSGKAYVVAISARLILLDLPMVATQAMTMDKRVGSVALVQVDSDSMVLTKIQAEDKSQIVVLERANSAKVVLTRARLLGEMLNCMQSQVH